MPLSRRQLFRAVASAGLSIGAFSWQKVLAAESLPPVRPLTRGPRFHWFGYYDKLQLDPVG
jgi:hypothetical protein